MQFPLLSVASLCVALPKTLLCFETTLDLESRTLGFCVGNGDANTWKGVADRRSVLDEGISVGVHVSVYRFLVNL